jgi:hypothetical protein
MTSGVMGRIPVHTFLWLGRNAWAGSGHLHDHDELFYHSISTLKHITNMSE